MVNHEALNCEQVWREISNYVDGDVDAALRVYDGRALPHLQAVRVGAGGNAECSRSSMAMSACWRCRRDFSQQVGEAVGEESMRLSGSRMVELVGVAGAGGGDGFDCRGLCGWRIRSRFRRCIQVATCGAGLTTFLLTCWSWFRMERSCFMCRDVLSFTTKLPSGR